MSVALRFAARSNIGLGRYKNNQDSGFAGNHVLAVCDGMGGHAGGDVASSIAVAHLAMLDGEAVGSDAPQELVETIRAAHAAMLERAHEDPEVSGLATTVTTLFKFGGKLALAHIGDSRAYLLTDDSLVQVTKDHTFVQWLVDQGTITEEEAAVHPQRSVITRVLGDVDASDEIDTSVREAVVGERWLLCSDGVSSYVSDATIESTLRTIEDLDACAEQLVELALKGGGQDNITCVVADVVDAAEVSTLNPVSVGAASVLSSNPTSLKSAAAKAAALTQPLESVPVLDEEPEPWGQQGSSRIAKFGIVFVIILALIGTGTFFGYRWSQTQFYVGIHEENVTIFRGIPDSIGSYELSSVHDKKNFPVDSLPDAPKSSLEKVISAQNLPDAERIVVDLIKQSKLCVAVNKPLPAVTSTPTPTEPLGSPASSGIPSPIAPDATQTETPIDPTATATTTPSPTATTAPTPQTPTVELNYLGEPLRQECDS